MLCDKICECFITTKKGKIRRTRVPLCLFLQKAASSHHRWMNSSLPVPLHQSPSVYESLHLWPSMWGSHPVPVVSERSANWPPRTPADFCTEEWGRNRSWLKKRLLWLHSVLWSRFPFEILSFQSSSPPLCCFHLDLKCSWIHQST